MSICADSFILQKILSFFQCKVAFTIEPTACAANHLNARYIYGLLGTSRVQNPSFLLLRNFCTAKRFRFHSLCRVTSFIRSEPKSCSSRPVPGNCSSTCHAYTITHPCKTSLCDDDSACMGHWGILSSSSNQTAGRLSISLHRHRPLRMPLVSCHALY